ncbi:hypothetical protein Sste5346_000215 [Sporothrix stenoceras]|uniref:Ribosomal protein S24/S35 mitochondrial conserved domain-containing protein n=1 Tax=Sporothrix stenoceras TaxID=5173 RepID=A0ABR3ZU98_9PEZI
MHQPSIRTALGRTSRLLSAAGTSSYAATSATRGPLSVTTMAFFSTTPSRTADNDKGDRQNRLAKAASAVSSLNLNNDSKSSSQERRPFNAASRDGPARPFGADGSSSSLGSKDGEGKESTSGKPGGIINIRSLPRKLPGGPRFAGSVGFGRPNADEDPHPSAPPRVITNPAFSASGLSGGGRGRGRGRGLGRGGAGASGARQGGARNRNRRPRDGEEDQESNPWAVEKVTFSPEMQEFFLKEDLGEYHDFEPALTLEGLTSYRPAVASSKNSVGGNVSMALREMRVLAGGDAFGGDHEQDATKLTAAPNALDLMERLHKGEMVYFDSSMERWMVQRMLKSRTTRRLMREDKIMNVRLLIQQPSKAVKDAVLETAIRGVYESKGTAAHSALMQTLQRYQDKEYTYTEEHKRQFAAKIMELLPEAAGEAAKAAKGGKRGKAAKA